MYYIFYLFCVLTADFYIKKQEIRDMDWPSPAQSRPKQSSVWQHEQWTVAQDL